MLFSGALMQPVAEIAERLSAPVPLEIDQVEVRLVRLPLIEPFETSFGRIDSRLIFLVRISAAGLDGWGEVVASEEPRYSYETTGTALHVIGRFLAPAAFARPVKSLEDLAERFSAFRGHNMAKAGLELAFVDLLAQAKQQRLWQLLGGAQRRIPVGVSLGIQPVINALMSRVERHLALGYQRIKLKIKPGWDIDTVAAVRHAHPDISLSVDANAAYTFADADHLRRLDDFGLLMIEQPLENDDLIDHAKLQVQFKTPLCLDESIVGVRSAKSALNLQSCRIVNIKVGRVGGYSQALAIHDLCLSAGIPVWCGGMLESGIGRVHNIALASLPGFTLPGDISASSRYFARDLIHPEVTVDESGTIEVPESVGRGFEIDTELIDSLTDSVKVFKRRDCQ